MPTYEYECLRCGHRFEEFQEITARPRSRCPQCRGKVRRVISAGAGIVFKGSGWYITDSRRPARGGAGTAGDSAAVPPAGEAEKSAATEAANAAKPPESKGDAPTKARRGPRSKPGGKG